MRTCCASCGFVCSMGLGMRALCQLLPGGVQGLARADTGLPHTADLGGWLRVTPLLPCSDKPYDSLQGSEDNVSQTT